MHIQHEEFVRQWKGGQLRIQVNRQLAWQAANSDELPKGSQFAHLFWSWAWILSIPAALAITYFCKWWVGLLILALIPPALLKSNRTGMMQDVIRYAVDNRDYYLGAIKSGLIRIEHPSAPLGKTGTMTDDEAVKIINAYGKAIMDRKAIFGDLSALPYPKARIKEALIHGIKEAEDPVFREQLKAAYVTLSEWQAGFEIRGAAVELSDEEQNDPVKAVARIATDADVLKVPQEVAEEANALLAELKAMKLA